jgi:ATP-dependent DNA ligase
MPVKVLADLRRRLDPLARKTSPLSVPPLRSTRFGSPLVLSRVHWVEPKLVAEITYLMWTADNLLRHTVYVGLREDKPADQVRREAPIRATCRDGCAGFTVFPQPNWSPDWQRPTAGIFTTPPARGSKFGSR